MICRFCPAAKRIKRNEHRCVVCIPYGMILKDDHECTREGWKGYVRADDHGDGFGEETGIQEDSGGAAEEVPGILPEPGE